MEGALLQTKKKVYRQKKNKNKKTKKKYIDANKLANVRTDKNKKRFIDAEILKTNSTLEEMKKATHCLITWKLNQKLIVLGFDSESEAVVLKDCKVIVEDVLENEKTPNECVHEYLNQETDQSRKSLPKWEE